MKTLTGVVCLLLLLITIGKAQDLENSNNNRFAIGFFKQVSVSEKGNVFFSPYSLSAAMCMAYAGSKGVTQNQISNVFHFPSNSEKFH
jgi:serpin B